MKALLTIYLLQNGELFRKVGRFHSPESALNLYCAVDDVSLMQEPVSDSVSQVLLITVV